MKKLHFITGLVTLIIFAMTGQYMELSLALAEQDFDVQRMMYRASHIYLFFAGAINFLLGCYWRPLVKDSATEGWLVKLQLLASCLLIIAQIILLLAFFIEPSAMPESRTLTFSGCLAVFLALLITAGVNGRVSRSKLDSLP